MSILTAVVVAEGVAILLLGVVVLGLLRSHALILRALHDLGAGLDLEREAAEDGATAGATSAPPAGSASGPVAVELERGVVPATRQGGPGSHDVVGTTLAGDATTVEVHGPGSRTLLAFLTTGCSVCQTFWEDFTAPELPGIPGGARLVVVAKGPQDESPAALRRLAGDRLEVLQSSGAWTDYDVPGSPYFILVEAGQVTGEGSATTWPQVRDLLAQAVEEAADARAAAGRSGPGAVTGSPHHGHQPGHGGHHAGDTSDPTGFVDRGERDDLTRVDSELLRAGITPGHPSLYEQPDHGTARCRGEHDDPGAPPRRPDGHRRGGPRDVVPLRRVDALEHQPAR
ncbi:MAG TPA: hypothetical protein VES95_00405 [Dermatophilaceae bacterium]|nr:hypothetical protein [Dermatophilaceae bacterium]